jgi:hypothetical protein
MQQFLQKVTSFGIPANSKMYLTGSGKGFLAPPNLDLLRIVQKGRNNGPFDFVGMGLAIGHFGTYDFQRNIGWGPLGDENNVFYPDYQNVSNYAVGAYLYGAGYNQQAAIGIAETFAQSMSSNAGSTLQVQWWIEGWNDASSVINYVTNPEPPGVP